MKKLILVIVLIPFGIYNAQWDLSVSMGLDFKSASSYRDYINSNFAPPNNKLKSFMSSVNFSFEGGFSLANNFQIAIEYSVLLDSYNAPIGVGGIYDISYIQHRPSIIGYYVISGIGYKFKFGGGIGVRLVSLTEEIFLKTEYTANGFGILLKGEGNTLLGGNFFALIGFDLRYDLPGEVSGPNNNKIFNNANGENLQLNSLSIGIKLGVSYQL